MNFMKAKAFVGLVNRIAINNRIFNNKPHVLTSQDNKKYCISVVKKYNLRKRKKSQEDLQKSYSGQDKIGAFGFFLLTIPIVTFILGTWQIKRRKWKLGLIEDLKKRISSDPIEIPNNLEDLNDKDYCPLKARGRFLYDKEFAIGPRSLILDGAGAAEKKGGIISTNRTTGYYLITPFKLEDRDLTILVNRGWVPPYLKNAEDRKFTQVNGIQEITGIIRLNETRPPFVPKNNPEKNCWMYRDINAMAEMAGTAPVFIDLVCKNDPPGAPVSGQTRVTIRNEHMSYIVTWYGLSAVTSWMWYRQFIKKLPLL